VQRADVVVAGLGALGAATVHELAKRGLSVVGVDRFRPPHPHGSTHGGTRIMRQAIGEGSAYVPLVLRSNELWREMEATTGATLLRITGGLVLGGSGAAGAMHGRPDFVARTAAAATAFGIEHELLDAGDIAARFPQFEGLRDEVAYYEPGAGLLCPEACVAAQLDLAERDGALLRFDEALVEFTAGGSCVEVSTSRDRYAAGRLVLALGAWLPRFAGPVLGRALTVHPQAMCWFDVAAVHEHYAPGTFPVFIWNHDGEKVYGLPAVDGPRGGVKVAVERFDKAVHADDADAAVSAKEIGRTFDTAVRGRLAGVNPGCVRAERCLYTCTPDFDFVIDRHPLSEAVTVVSACSGHGFKHSPAVGEAVAQMITEGRSAIDLSPFCAARLEPAIAPGT
jgi:sarcosine oxidase